MCFWSSAAELARRRRPSPSATELLRTHRRSQTVSRSSLYNMPKGTEATVPSQQRAPSCTFKASFTRHQPQARVSLTVPSATDVEPELEAKMSKPTIQTRTGRSSSGRTPRTKRDTTSLPPSPVPKLGETGRSSLRRVAPQGALCIRDGKHQISELVLVEIVSATGWEVYRPLALLTWPGAERYSGREEFCMIEHR
ncbi:hypothetical protein OIDMADRAFT_25170 [Oidiodendron maius Zn]|uniref:Uncharacterized protein n=1 Tax=Oidiodendron maius (strain Zn) TaxID=913774 RepID=A0A0C3HQD4_OIDMZ|nr:hypothetical protein OIDMADRAFT_25170 [Oidiodendron maius Zn]